MDMLEGLLFGVMDHVDVPTVIPADVHTEAVTEIRHGDGIGQRVVATDGESVTVHFVCSVALLM